MLVKFFRYGQGVSGSVEYLLNERESQGTAKTLRGNPQLTQSIIKNIPFKNKYKSGVLSFEESSLDTKTKNQIMDDFEKVLLAGLDKEQYNILWVEHNDKNRVELNFVIPRINLETQRAFNPYYAKIDQDRVNTFKDLQNIKHNLADPNNPQKQRTHSLNNNLKTNKDFKKLDELLHNLISQGVIKNRTQLIEQLKQNDIEVPRVGKDYISIKLPDNKKAKRFKGTIYSEQFTEPRSIETISNQTEQRIREYDKRDTRSEHRELENRLEYLVSRKVKYYESRYPSTVKKVKPKISKDDKSKSHQNTNLSYSYISWNDTRDDGQTRNNYVLYDQQRLDSAKFYEIQNFQWEIYSQYQRYLHDEQLRNQSQLKDNQDRRLEDDTIRESIARRDKLISEQRRDTIEQFEKSRESLLTRIKKLNSTIHSRVEQISTNISDKFGEFKETIRRFTSGQHEDKTKPDNTRQKAEQIDRIIDELEAKNSFNDLELNR